jgi:hypothetical protein
MDENDDRRRDQPDHRGILNKGTGLVDHNTLMHRGTEVIRVFSVPLRLGVSLGC